MDIELDSELKKCASAKQEAMKSSGTITPFNTNKRKRGTEAHFDFLAAIGRNDTAAMQELVREHGEAAYKPTNFTKADRSRLFSDCSYDCLIKCSAEVLREALRLGLKTKGKIEWSWKRPGHLEAYIEAGLVCQEVGNDVLHTVLHHGSIDDLSKVWRLLSISLSLSLSIKSLAESWTASPSEKFSWFLEQGVIPKTEEMLVTCLQDISHSWFITDYLPAFEVPPSTEHLKTCVDKSSFCHLLKLPAYAALVDSEFVEWYATQTSLHFYSHCRNATEEVYEAFKGPLEPKHCLNKVAYMKAVAKFHPLTPDLVNFLDVSVLLDAAPNLHVSAVVDAIEDREKALSDIVNSFKYEFNTVEPRVYEVAIQLAALRKDRRHEPLPNDVYSEFVYRRNNVYRKLLHLIHDTPQKFM
jgi:hypothetical protein